jgi:hypothetical protein
MFLGAQVLEKEPTKKSNGKKRVNHNKMGVKEKKGRGERGWRMRPEKVSSRHGRL